MAQQPASELAQDTDDLQGHERSDVLSLPIHDTQSLDGASYSARYASTT